MNYLSKSTRETILRKEKVFEQKMLSFQNDIKVLAKKHNIVDISDKDWISEYYGICEEYKTHKWTEPDKEYYYFSNMSYSSLRYSDLLTLDLKDQHTGLYKKVYLKSEDEPIIKNIQNIINILEQALYYNTKVFDYDYTHFDRKRYNICTDQRSYIFNKLGNIYSLYFEVEKCIEYFEQAASLNNPNAMKSLIYIYTTEEYLNLDRALYFYNQIKEKHYKSDNMIFSLHYLLQYYIDNGLYKEAELHIEEFKKDVIPHLQDKHYLQEVNDLLCEMESHLNRIKIKNQKIDALNKYFPNEIIAKMDDNIKVFIFTSIDLKQYIDEQNNNGKILDYSGAILPVMKALETILFEIYDKHYLKYLNDIKDTIDLSKIDKYLINNKDLRKHLDKLEIGIALFMVVELNKDEQGNITKCYERSYFGDFCKTKCKMSNFEAFIYKYAQNLSIILDQRNKTAHKARRLKEDAEEVNRYLLEQYEFIKFLYESFSVLFE